MIHPRVYSITITLQHSLYPVVMHPRVYSITITLQHSLYPAVIHPRVYSITITYIIRIVHTVILFILSYHNSVLLITTILYFILICQHHILFARFILFYYSHLSYPLLFTTIPYFVLLAPVISPNIHNNTILLSWFINTTYCLQNVSYYITHTLSYPLLFTTILYFYLDLSTPPIVCEI